MFSLLLHPQRSLSANLFWRFFFLSLPLLLAGGLIVSSFAEKQLRQEASKNLAAVAADKAGKIETYARNKLNEVVFMASQPYMPDFLGRRENARQKQRILAFLQNIRGYSNLYLFSSTGHLLFTQNGTSDTTPELIRIVDQTRTLLSAEISDYTPDPKTQIPAVYVAAPVFGPGGSVAGVVAARLANEEIYRVVNDYSNLGRTGETVMAQSSADQIVVVTPLRNRPAAAFHLRFPALQAPPSILASVEGMRVQAVTTDYRGKKVLAVSRYLPSLGWGLVVKMDAEEIFAPAADLKRGMWIGGVILILLFAAGAQISAQSLNRPLSILIAAARDIERGNLATRVCMPFRKDEFSYLAQTFNAMIEQVQEATQKLRETNESLEQKVAERTDDLQVKTLEAERANQSKSQFLANMSHEIRTPLNAILGYAQILFRDEVLHPFQRDAIGTIMKSSEHMLRLINEILDLSKIDAGRMEVFPEDFDLRKMIEEMEELFQPACEEKGLGLRLDLQGPDHSFPAHGDEGKLRQVLINLLGNAVKFTERGAVRAVIRRTTGDQVFFEITDTGPGIPPQSRDRVFEPFQQGPQGAAAGGTGLGLAIAQKQVEVMGGKLVLECPPTEGSRLSFTLSLPPALRVVAHRSQEVERLASGFQVRALVVDDIRENREILYHLLERVGCQVALAGTGAEAIAMACTTLPDIVLMDMRLPDGSGLAAVQAIRGRLGERAPKMIAVSASALAHEKNLYLSGGCDDFIAKPFRAERIFASLSELLQVTFLQRTSRPSFADTPPVDLTGIPLPESLVDRMVVAAELHSTTTLKRCLKEMEDLGENEKRLASHLRNFLASCDIVAIQGIIAQMTIKAEAPLPAE